MSRSRKRIPKQASSEPAAAAPPAPLVRGLSAGWTVAALGVILALVTLTYANHFHNSFHFDDAYSIVSNPYIRDLHNVPLIFRDARTSHVHTQSQHYRPLLTTSCAVDYWLGHGLEPFWFHLSTFVWYLVQLTLMFLLFRRVFDAARPDPRNAWVALFATALYGLHPAMAETVNYIYQRGDLYSAVAVIAGLVTYAFAPGLRRYGVYLLPVALGMLAKEPTVVFPAMLFLWIWLIEDRGFFTAAVRCIPAGVVTGALALFVVKMGGEHSAAGYGSPYNFRISQPAVLLGYFRKFFVPLDLSADTDHKPYDSLLNVDVVLGFFFLAILCAVMLWSLRRRETRPIAFGLAWYLVASLPTSWFAIGEVENDHRMFLPFVGLTMGLCWAAALWLSGRTVPRAALAGACAVVLGLAAWGTRQRNIVWHTEESLWLDVTRKSPENGRGLMNYGLSQMSQGRYRVALDYYTRALVYNPDYPLLEINLGIVNAALRNNEEAERHFLRSIKLVPYSAESKRYYAIWLEQVGRVPESISNLRQALVLKPDDIDSRHALMRIYGKQGEREKLRAMAEETLRIFPSDAASREWLAKASG
jgi:protein O-mannosyl-transferase